MRRWEARQKHVGKKRTKNDVVKPGDSTTTLFAATANFTVNGIKNGIILAVPASKASAQGVLWPARVQQW